MTQPRTLFVVLAAATLTCTFIACDDETGDDDDNNNTSSGTAGNGGSSSGSCAKAGTDCQTLCEILYCCAEPLCSLVDASIETEYIAGCVETCESPDGAALKAIIDGDDCATTVGTIKAANNQFSCACDGTPHSGQTCDTGGGGAGGG